QAMAQAQSSLSKAANSFPLGRNGRIRDALGYLFRTAQELFETGLWLQTVRGQVIVWQTQHQWVQQQRSRIHTFIDRLSRAAQELETASQRRQQQLGQAG